MELFKGTRIYSILTGYCPVCHEESMYKESNPYKLGSIFKMQERCSHCQTKYKIEPSFFYGAMYVSYAVCGNLKSLRLFQKVRKNSTRSILNI